MENWEVGDILLLILVLFFVFVFIFWLMIEYKYEKFNETDHKILKEIGRLWDYIKNIPSKIELLSKQVERNKNDIEDLKRNKKV